MKKLYILLFIATQSLYGQGVEPDPLPDTLIEKAFLVADANGDGVLTKKEFKDPDRLLMMEKNIRNKGNGVYFGRDATKKASEDAGQYASESGWSSTYGQGFMYEMELKPNAKVVKYGNYVNLTKSDYQMLRLQNIQEK